MTMPALDLGRIEKVPWSVLGPEFIQVWGYAKPADPQPEHLEVIGQNGSGKSYFVLSILQERMLVRNTPEIHIMTKPADSTANKIGWPIVDSWEGVRENRQCIFWPRTDKLGLQRKDYQRDKIQDLLNRLWHPNSNTVLSFDEIAYIESLTPAKGSRESLRDTIDMYWREARSQGITMVATKQRPQGTSRSMHSETPWTVLFVPADHDDRERFAELLGKKQDWLPIFDLIDPMNNEFIIRHTKTGDTFISFIDIPLVPIKPRDESIKEGRERRATM